MDMDQFPTTISDDNISTETPPISVIEKDSIIDSSVSTSTATTTNDKIPNSSPIIKLKLPKLAITAGKPLR